MSDTTETLEVIEGILNEVAGERMNHLDKWGVQDHPSFRYLTDVSEFKKKADYYKAIWEARKRMDVMSWDVILLEEVYEACSEPDDALRRAELVQVAAVAVAEIEAIDRRAGQESDDEPEDPEPLPA